MAPDPERISPKTGLRKMVTVPIYNKTAKTTGLPVDEAARKNGEATQSVSNIHGRGRGYLFSDFKFNLVGGKSYDFQLEIRECHFIDFLYKSDTISYIGGCQKRPLCHKIKGLRIF